MLALEFNSYAGAARHGYDLSLAAEEGEFFAIFDEEFNYLGYRAKTARNNYIIPHPRELALVYGNGGGVSINKGDRLPKCFHPLLKPFNLNGLIEAPQDW